MKDIIKASILLVFAMIALESRAGSESVQLRIGERFTCDVAEHGNNNYPWSIVNMQWEFSSGLQFSNTYNSWTNDVWVDSYVSGQLYAKVSWAETKLGSSDDIWNHKSYTWYFTIIYNPVTGITLQSPISVNADEQISITPSSQWMTISPSNGWVESTKWESSNPSVATIDNNGKLKALWPGTTTISCTMNGSVRSNDATVQVTEPSFSFYGFSVANGATNVATRPTITATYSLALSRSYDFGGIALTDGQGQKVEGSTSISGATLSFTPAQHLQPLTAYTLTIPMGAVKNKWGTDYASAKTVSFTTADWKQMQLTVEPAYKFVNRGDQITLKASSSEAEIFYSTDGSDPKQRYTGPLTFAQDMTLKAVARQDGYYDSPLLVQDYLQCVEIAGRFPDVEPLYFYADVNPSLTYTNLIHESGAFKDICLLKEGTEAVDMEAVIYENTITFVPSRPLEDGCLYVLSMPEGAVVTEQGEENKAMEWRISTGCYPIAVSTGGQELAAAVMADGSLWTWGMRLTEANAENGSYRYTTVKQPTIFVNGEVTAVSSGLMHHALLKKDGSLWMWGRQLCGEFGNGSLAASATPVKVLDGVKSVSCGWQNTAIIKEDGTLWMCGRNDFGQVGNGQRETATTFVKVMDGVRVASVGGYSSYAIRQDGTLWQWGGRQECRLTPRQLMSQVQTVEVNGESTAVTKTDGTLWTWTESDPTPVQVLNGMTDASAGDGSYMGLGADGILWTWGVNDYGQLGNSQTTDVSTPVEMMAEVMAGQFGWKNAVALQEDGSVWTWGLNSRGVLGDGTTASMGIYNATPTEVIGGRKSESLEGISVTPEMIHLNINEKAVIQVRPIPLLADYEQIIWSIDDEAIADVSPRGVVTAKSNGRAIVTATIHGKGASYKTTCQIVVGTDGISPLSDGWALRVSASNGKILVSGVPLHHIVSVYDLSGTCFYQRTMTSKQLMIPVLQQGVYIIRAGKQVRKVIVRVNL